MSMRCTSACHVNIILRVSEILDTYASIYVTKRPASQATEFSKEDTSSPFYQLLEANIFCSFQFDLI